MMSLGVGLQQVQQQAVAQAAALPMQPARLYSRCIESLKHQNKLTSPVARCIHLQQMQPLARQQHRYRQKMRRSVAAATSKNNSPASDGISSTPLQQQQQEQPDNSSSSSGHHQQRQQKAIPRRVAATTDQETYSLEATKTLVETAMLSAVSGLTFLLSTLLKLDNSLGYFLPLPIAIAACRSGIGAAWHTMMATAFLLLVLLGPLRAITYVLMHGGLAAALGSMWVWQWPWAASILAGAVLRMSGQLGYLVLSSLTMNENLFAVMLANVHNLLDQLSAALGSTGSASALTISCIIFALLLVNGICHVFLLHVVYHVILSAMGFKLGALPGFVRKYVYAGVPQQPAAKQA